MIRTKNKGAKYSSIVGIGEKIKRLEKEKGVEFLKLNRGVNMVVNMNIDNFIKKNIDFNNPELQIYGPNKGIESFRKSINKDYFDNTSDIDNIFIVNGGMSGLDLIMKTINVSKVFYSKFYWGAYKNILKINNIDRDTYDSYEYIHNNMNDYKDKAIIICDPNNPIGNKYPDDSLLYLIKKLKENRTTVIFDSPYRRLFIKNNNFYKELLKLDNVIINESFSKRMGLSGQRIGFVHSINKDFNEILNINLLFATNSINVFGQILIDKLLSTEEGNEIVEDFRKKTYEDILKNIKFLKESDLLADELYENTFPMGIFTIIKTPFNKLLKNNIGSVSLSYFTEDDEVINKNYSRICVSVDHKKFKSFFNKMLIRDKIEELKKELEIEMNYDKSVYNSYDKEPISEMSDRTTIIENDIKKLKDILNG